MKRFSVIDFYGQVYVLSGKVDKFALQDYSPIVDELELLEKTEVLKVFYTVYWWNDGSDSNSDLDEVDVFEIKDHLNELMSEEGALTEISTGKIELEGHLTQPFEDAYNLQGAERERYLSEKAASAREHAATEAQLRAQGLSDDEIEQWFRYAMLKEAMNNLDT